MTSVGQAALDQILGTVMPYLIVFFAAAALDIVVYQLMLHRARLEYGNEREARASVRGSGWLVHIAVLILGIGALTIVNS